MSRINTAIEAIKPVLISFEAGPSVSIHTYIYIYILDISKRYRANRLVKKIFLFFSKTSTTLLSHLSFFSLFFFSVTNTAKISRNLCIFLPAKDRFHCLNFDNAIRMRVLIMEQWFAF